MGNAVTNIKVEMTASWGEVLTRAVHPQCQRMAEEAQRYIDSPSGAPIGGADDPHPGRLREASFARVKPGSAVVELGVDLSRAPWGLYVLMGTRYAHANKYLWRAAEHALQTQRHGI